MRVVENRPLSNNKGFRSPVSWIVNYLRNVDDIYHPVNNYTTQTTINQHPKQPLT